MPRKGNCEGDKNLFQVQVLLDALNESLEIDDKHLSIDEFIIPFKGRSRLKQYNKIKPHKWGIKVSGLCGVSGMLYDLEIYTGKDTLQDKTKLGISGDIVVPIFKTLFIAC
nr:uncharacterized protein LOC122271301 [Parasteatoda tepidariorum]